MASPVRDCIPSDTTLAALPAVFGGTAREAADPSSQPGDRLRRLRNRLGLSTRKVAECSREVARRQGSAEFAISHARMVQIENGGSAPSIYKLFSLSAIYGVAVGELLSFYVREDEPARLHLAMGHAATHLAALEHLHEPGFRYGYIGLSDVTMSPLIRPGATVQIDTTQKVEPRAEYRNEYERPVYFLETREGYLCSWCEMASGRLLAIPHPLSPARTRTFAYPAEVDVVGRVTAVTSRI
jgi:transcriptional regulator with XRE-family HTH domain